MPSEQVTLRGLRRIFPLWQNCTDPPGRWGSTTLWTGTTPPQWPFFAGSHRTQMSCLSRPWPWPYPWTWTLLQASLHQACLGPLPCLQPTRQPQGQPGQHVPEVRIGVLTRQEFERTCFCFLGIGASSPLLILRFLVASFKKLWYCTLIPDIRILTGWLGSLQGFGQSVVRKGGLFHYTSID